MNMKRYGIIISPTADIYAGPGYTKLLNNGLTASSITDEGLFGNAGRILKEEGEWVFFLSSYGYSGYIARSNILPVDEMGLEKWSEDQKVITGINTDVLTIPDVEGVRLITLPRGAVVQKIEEIENGWTKVRLPDEREGFVSSSFLMEKYYSDELMRADAQLLLSRQAHAQENKLTAVGGSEGFSFTEFLNRPDLPYNGSEEAFRQYLMNTAQGYLGVQYRWGGRSSCGIDCSGLVHMSYLLCGLGVYRDAVIVDGYPLKRLELAFEDGRFSLSNLDSDILRPGDTLYFPGHVAIYAGGGLYIHSTGKAGDRSVVHNSLRPGHNRFRQDLLDSMYAAAGIR